MKRGGRTNLNAQRTLDSIVVGRISQMTDPSLDAARHTFDIRSPFGRVLSAKDLPLKVENGKLVSIISDRDLMRVAPSPATTLSRFEINSLLDKMQWDFLPIVW